MLKINISGFPQKTTQNMSKCFKFSSPNFFYFKIRYVITYSHICPSDSNEIHYKGP